MKEEEDDEDNTAIGVARYPCMPSLVALQQMRNRLHLAHVGKKLMKWTAMATGREMRKIAGEMIELYDNYDMRCAHAFMLLARCRYFYPNLNRMVVNNPPRHPREATVTVTTTQKSITGCKVLAFEIIQTGTDNYEHLAIEKGGQAVADAKKAWYELLITMIQILQLRSSFELTDYAHKSASKKMNVLGKIVIPRTESSIHYILAELEEREREEFFRMKKIIQVKEKAKAKCGHEEWEVTCPMCLRMRARDEEVQAIKSRRCIICGAEIVGSTMPKEDELTIIRELKELLLSVVTKAKQTIEKGYVEGPISEFTGTAESIKEKLQEKEEKLSKPIPLNVQLEKLCMRCKVRLKHQVLESEANAQAVKEEVSIKVQSEVSFVEEELDFGSFETEVKEVTRIIRTKNPDGTITEEKKVVKVRREVKTPNKKRKSKSTIHIDSPQQSTPSRTTRGSAENEDGNLVFESSEHSNKSNTYNGPKTIGIILVTSAPAILCLKDADSDTNMERMIESHDPSTDDSVNISGGSESFNESEKQSTSNNSDTVDDKKMNVLSKIVIPKTVLSIEYILLELEELAREELFRIKLVSKNKAKKKMKAKPKPKEEICPVCSKLILDKPAEHEEHVEEEVKPVPKPKPIIKDPLVPKVSKVAIVEPKKEEIRPTPIRPIAPPPPPPSIEKVSTKSIPQTEPVVPKTEPEATEELLDHSHCRVCGKTMLMTQKEKRLSEADIIMDTKSLQKLLEGQELPCEAEMGKFTAIDSDDDEMWQKKEMLMHLASHIDEVVDMAQDYRYQGLLSPSVEDFLKSCEQIKAKIDDFIKTDYTVATKKKIEDLLRKVKGLECLTTHMKEEGIEADSLARFLSSCLDFEEKLQSSKKKVKSSSNTSLLMTRLAARLDEAKELGVEAQRSGINLASVDNFIRQCDAMKEKVTNKQKESESKAPLPNVLKSLDENVGDVIDLIKNLKVEGIVSDSVEEFLKSCVETRQEIPTYQMPKEADSHTTCGQCSEDITCASTTSPDVCDRCEEMFDRNKKAEVVKDVPPLCNTCRGIETNSEEPSDEFPCETCKHPPVEPEISPEPSIEQCGICQELEQELPPETEISLPEILLNPPVPEVYPANDLGYFEKKVRTITKLRRTKQDDGTVKEEREIITIREEKHDPNETDMCDDDDLDNDISYETLLREQEEQKLQEQLNKIRNIKEE